VYSNSNQKSIDLIIQQMDATWRIAYMLINRKPTAGDRWTWEKTQYGYRVYVNGKFVSSDPQVVAKLQMIAYLDEQLKQLRIEGSESDGEV
jgi:hypothetical protein